MSLTYAQLIDGSVVSISFGAGTQSAPSLYYTVDTTTGIFFPGTGTLALTTSGAERVRVDSLGNVGIGRLAAAGYLLDMQAASAAARLTSSTGTTICGYFAVNTGGFVYLGAENSAGGSLFTGTAPYSGIAGTSGAYPFALATNGVERLRVTTAGNIAIGTSSSGTDRLTVRGDATTNYADIAFSHSSNASTGASLGFTDSVSSNNLSLWNYENGYLRIGTNNVERVRIDSVGNVGIGLAGSAATAYLHLAAGGTAASTSPLKLTSGSLLTTAEVGSTEFDGLSLYFTTNTTSTGRGQVVARQIFRLAANGSALGPTIADYFGATSSINLPAAGVYEIEYFLYFTKTTTGTVTFTLTASSAPTGIFGTYIGAPATGVGSGVPQSGYTGSQAATTAAFPASTANTGVNHSYTIRAQIITNAATTFKVQVTSSLGTVTPLAGSFYAVRRVAASTGNFA